MGTDLKGKEIGEGLSQLKNEKYIARYTDKYGKRKQKYFDNLKEAKSWLAESKYNEEHSNILNPDRINVQSWYDNWIELKRKTVRLNTYTSYEVRYNKDIKPIIGDMLVSDVKPIHCQLVLNKMADNGSKSSSIRITRAILYNLFEYAKENDIIGNNPCKKSVKSDIGKPSEEKKAMSIEEQRNFLIAVRGHKFENQFRLALQTGIRLGELAGLKWDDIDFENRSMTIRRTMDYKYSTHSWVLGEPKSKSGNRVIPLTEEALKILRYQKEKDRKLKVISLEWAEMVFLDKDGTPPTKTAYDAVLTRVCKKNELNHISMHILRHTFATRCIEAGMKPKTLQTILGHSTLGTTMNLYVHITEDEKFKEVMAIENMLKIV